jgi:hypothetical protein
MIPNRFSGEELVERGFNVSKVSRFLQTDFETLKH